MNDKHQTIAPQRTLKEAIPEIAEIILRAYVADSDIPMFDPAEHQTLDKLFEAARPNDYSDPLFWYVVAELHDTREDGVDWALTRLDSAINEILRVRNAIAQRLGQPAGMYINQQMLSGFVGTSRQLTLKDSVNPSRFVPCDPDSLIDELTVEDEGGGGDLADFD